MNFFSYLSIPFLLNYHHIHIIAYISFHCSREGDRAPVTFYAIYYQSDYAYTGSVQTFTAPVSGIYEFELWGSPGGALANTPLENRSKGGYTKFYMHVDVVTKIYCFVGGSGNPAGGNVTVGGWNGGGSVSTCYNGAHAGSGGGMTHVSYTNNLATTYWNPYGTIGVAGGGGGSSRYARGGDAGGLVGSSGSGSGMNSKKPHEPYGATQTSGYRQGVGEPNCNSAGGGGGWYGGWSTGHTKQTNGGNCRAGGGGGSGYICEAGKQTEYSYLNKCLAGYENIPVKPNGDVNGYIRITLYERD